MNTLPETPARPAYRPTNEDQYQISIMCAIGMRPDQIAHVMDLPLEILREHFQRELDHAAVYSNAKATSSLYELAISGDVRAAIFWAKTRCGLRTVAPSRQKPKRASKQASVPNRPG